MKKAVYNDVSNEFEKMVSTLNGVMREDKFRQFPELAE